MKCCSRSTLGVIIGSLNILISVVVSIFLVQVIQEIQHINSDKEKDVDATSTILLSSLLAGCLVMGIISGVLIMGIVKRRHKLMLPWLILSGLGFACECLRVVLMLIIGLVQGQPTGMLFLAFFIGVVVIGLQALILWAIYTLYQDIRRKNNEMPEQIGQANAPPLYNYYSELPQKS